MKNARLFQALLHAAPRVSVLLLAGSLGVATAVAQDAQTPKGAVKDGYLVRQTIDLGGHIADYSGSAAMYDTLVNLQTGPRILNQTLQMHAVDGSKHFLFDTLFTGSAGYGGDPNDFTTLRMSKGRAYEFNGLFRRDRQYFDYDLFSNPLVPAGLVSNGYTFPQVNHTPHLFNTVRRMTDADLTLFPLSRIRIRAGYSQNVAEGPTYSSIHQGANALLLQYWRNSTDTWRGVVDWKPSDQTVLTFQETVTHYKGDTSYQLAGLTLQLSNGTPVTLGFDNVTVPAPTSAKSLCGARPAILDSTTNPPTANPCENGFLQDSRSAPTRTWYPTEEFRFQSSAIRNFQTNGRFSYTSVNMHLPNYFESFNGLESRTTTRAFTIHGHSAAERINVSADYGFAWNLSDRVVVTEQFDFQDWRQPSWNYLSEVAQLGTSMLAAPGIPQAPAITDASNFLGQRAFNNTFALEVQPTPKASVSIGYHIRDRKLHFISSEDGEDYNYRDTRNAAVFSTVVRPISNLKINGSVELGIASNVYVQIAPKNYQSYQARAAWKPRPWATISGAFLDTERRNKEINVGYRAHTRSATVTASVAPSERYGVDLSYGYLDTFSTVRNCFYSGAFVPAGATPMPGGAAAPACGNVNVYSAATGIVASPGYYGTSYYDAPTQYGNIGLVYSPVKPLRATAGYRMSAVDGHTEFLNPRNVPGSLQSQFQTPYASLAYTIAAGWGFSGNWNYYSYGEGSPIGPTLPRSFRGNLYTLGMHYEF